MRNLLERSDITKRREESVLCIRTPILVAKRKGRSAAEGCTSEARKPGETAWTRARAEPLVVTRCGVIAAGIGIESVQLKNLRDTAAALLSFEVDDEIN